MEKGLRFWIKIMCETQRQCWCIIRMSHLTQYNEYLNTRLLYDKPGGDSRHTNGFSFPKDKNKLWKTSLEVYKSEISLLGHRKKEGLKPHILTPN